MMDNNDFQIIDTAVERYCELHTTSEDVVLSELSRETNLKTIMPRMMSGNMQGRFLTMLVELMKPKAALEIGTFTGYSAICIAKGLSRNGMLTTIDNNPEIEDIARNYFKKSGLDRKIHFIIGDALTLIPTFDIMFDMIFIDADKHRLSEYYHLALEKTKSGGIILADNILWSGKVVDYTQHDSATLKIRDFNDMVQADARVDNILLPLRDGLMMIKKK
jgi:predicted O-methyltransferase YrrM